jgi:quaternary ammonium compound-resistance protein SugE
LLSVGFLAQVVASRTAGALPIGTAYALWTGVGAVGTAVLGMALFGEATHPARVGCLLFIVAGVVGLELAAGE